MRCVVIRVMTPLIGGIRWIGRSFITAADDEQHPEGRYVSREVLQDEQGV
jgi:hypothetical protein